MLCGSPILLTVLTPNFWLLFVIEMKFVTWSEITSGVDGP